MRLAYIAVAVYAIVFLGLFAAMVSPIAKDVIIANFGRFALTFLSVGPPFLAGMAIIVLFILSRVRDETPRNGSAHH